MLGHLHRNWLSYFVLIGIALVFTFVEQVHHLFETPRAVTRSTWLVALGLYGFIAALAALYAGVSWWVAPFNLNRLGVGPQTDVWSRARDFILARRRLIAALCGAACIILYIASRLIGAGSHVGDHTVLGSFGLLFAAGAWLVVVWDTLLPESQRLLLRAFIALIAFNLLGEVIWLFSNEASLFSPRNYSIWAILHLAFCALLYARVVDVWQLYSDNPVRGLAILLAVAGAAWSEPTVMGRLRSFAEISGLRADEAVPPDQTADAEQFLASSWLVHIRNRIRDMPSNGPVILIAASGGGSRAALFTALVYEDLARMSLDGAGRSIDFAPVDHILLISSVSGGTLASACYLDSGYSARLKAEPERKTLRNSMEAELLASIEVELKKLENLPWYQRVNPETSAVEEDFVRTAHEELKAGAKASWFRSAFADDMCTDFMAPLLRGVIHPGRDRGESVQLFWETRFGLRETNLDWLNSAYSGNASNRPALLSNVCEVERGTRLIIGFPPLPPGFLQRGRQSADLPREWVDLDARQGQVSEVSLADATRMSANFPWGFPVASVQIPQLDANDNLSRPDVHLIDGGVRDNTGIDSLQYVIEALGDWAEKREGSSPEHQYKQRLASEIIGELKRRGVLLLEIDSGAKQGPSGAMSRLLSGFLEPINALQNATYSTAAAALESHVEVIENSLPNSQSDRLRKRLGRLAAKASTDEAIDSVAALGVRNVRRLTITCNHQDNVMTAWALGPTDKAQIFARFLAGSARLHYELQEYLQNYDQVHSALGQLAARVDELERQQPPSSESIVELLDLFKRLSTDSLAVVNTQDFRIASEKMFYRGVALSEDFPQQVAAEVRSKPEWKITLPKVIVKEPPQTDSDAGVKGAPPEPIEFSKSAEQYQVLGKKVDETDWSVKLRSQDTFQKIDELTKER